MSEPGKQALLGLADNAQKLLLPAQQCIAFLGEVFVLVISRADRLPAPCHLIEHTVSDVLPNAEGSHARCRLMPQIMQPEVLNSVVSHHVADSVR